MEGWRLLAPRRGEETIVDALTRDDFDDPEDRGGVSGNSRRGVVRHHGSQDNRGKLSERPKADTRPEPPGSRGCARRSPRTTGG
jgi:hypothetical protein